jgi:hypothetical protein
MVPTDIRYDGAMSELGQNRKSSTRANVFRFAPKSGHRATESACPFRAKNRHWRPWMHEVLNDTIQVHRIGGSA